LRRTRFEIKTINGIPEMSWHGFEIDQPDWTENSHSLAIRYVSNPEYGDCDMYIMFNSDKNNHSFKLPKLKNNKKWFRVLDTYCEPPEDIFEFGKEKNIEDQTKYNLQSFSVALLISKG